MATEDHLSAARELLAGSPLVDGHNDLAWAARTLCGYDPAALDISQRQTRTHTDLPRLREGRVGAQFWSVYVPSTLPPDAAVVATLEQIDYVHAIIRRHPGDLGLALTAGEVEAVFARGAIASLLGAEGGHSIACSMAVLRMLYALGVRYLTLTHNDNTPWADSATDEPRSGGLTAFGRAVVGEMNRLGMLVDLSHVSEATMSGALDTTEAPVIFSHSSARALVDHPRNVPDAVLARLAGNGGVCMVAFVSDFVSPAFYAWRLELIDAMRRRGLEPFGTTPDHERLTAEHTAAHPRPRATVHQVADHIDHVREVAGVEHVGIGGDYDGCDDLPQELEDVAQYPRLFAELLARGWSESDCRRLAGGNVLRVLRDAEGVASRLRESRPPSLATLEGLDGAS